MALGEGMREVVIAQIFMPDRRNGSEDGFGFTCDWILPEKFEMIRASFVSGLLVDLLDGVAT